jgi:hypothetical protein
VQPDLLGFNRQPSFDGSTFEVEHDQSRLTKQLDVVREVLLGGQWHTPEQLEAATGYRWASISARIRDLRKSRFGAFVVERRSCGERAKGCFEYRIKVGR